MFANKSELERGIDEIKKSPSNIGKIELIVRRPSVGGREVVEKADLDITSGLVGDNWLERGTKRTRSSSVYSDMQINIMNSRCIALIAKSKDRWPLAGDQFFIDLDLSKENLPAGTVLEIGSAKLLITAEPHLGCKKFLERFGKDAVMLVNSDIGKAMNLRGVNARVLQAGTVQTGDTVKKAL